MADERSSATVAVPILRVSHLDRALAWWRRLGFVEEFRHQFEPGFPCFVGVVRDECRVYLSQHDGDAAGPGLLYLWVADVDPDGNRVRVASPPPTP